MNKELSKLDHSINDDLIKLLYKKATFKVLMSGDIELTPLAIESFWNNETIFFKVNNNFKIGINISKVKDELGFVLRAAYEQQV
ncbi:MAG: hypothetical protein ACK41T_00715 [Pseudobdellovibrio sp.]